MIKPGKTAPDFTLPDAEGEKIKLSDLRGQNIILYFYPRDMTPGCTIEANQFTKIFPKLTKINTIVLGVSTDSCVQHKKFIEKEKLRFTLLSDENQTVIKKYDVIKEKNMYGKKVWGVERSTFLIDAGGKILKIFRKVKADGHAEEVLKIMREDV